MKTQVILTALAVSIAMASPVSAVPVGGITFSGAYTAGDESFTVPIDGDLTSVTATFADPTREVPLTGFSNFFSAFNIGSGATNNGFTLVFNETVDWIGGVLLFAPTGIDAFDGFDVVGPGVAATAVNAGIPLGAFSFTTPIRFLTGETYAITALNSVVAGNPGGHSYASWSFEQPVPVPVSVPVPATLVLLLAGSGGMVLLRRAAPNAVG